MGKVRGPGHTIYGEMMWVPGFFLVAQRTLRGMGLTVDFNYLKESYKDSGTKLLVVTDGKKKAEGMVTSCILGNSGRT